jgi:hypothetical protein
MNTVVKDGGDSARERGADEIVKASNMLRATMSINIKASKRCVCEISMETRDIDKNENAGFKCLLRTRRVDNL